MYLLRLIVLSIALLVLNLAFGADSTIPGSGVSTQTNEEISPAIPSGSMSCMRMAYDHFLGLGNTPRNAYNNAVNACRNGIEPDCLDRSFKHYQAIGQNQRTAWNNAVRDCRELMPPRSY